MLIAVVFLTVAYALFSNNLNIQNMSATVKANEANFSVKFSNSSTKVDESDVIPHFTHGATGTLLDAHIDNSGLNPKLTNIGANFDSLEGFDGYTDYKQGWAGYDLYVINDGEYDAYLKSIKIENVPGYNKPLVCIPTEGTSQTLVDEACKSFRVLVGTNSKYIDVTSEGIKHGDSNYINQPGNYTGITGIKLAKPDTSRTYPYSNHYVSISIGALSENTGAAASAIDGSYEVKIGDVTVEYSTQD